MQQQKGWSQFIDIFLLIIFITKYLQRLFIESIASIYEIGNASKYIF